MPLYSQNSCNKLSDCCVVSNNFISGTYTILSPALYPPVKMRFSLQGMK